MNIYKHILFCLGIIVSLGGCSLKKNIPEKEVLLNSTSVKNSPKDLESGLENLIQQTPNGKLLGLFRLSMWIYLKFDQGEPNGFKNGVKNSLGSKPVYLDSNKILKSAEQMQRYLVHHGYFDNKVDYEINTNGKKADVNFKVKSGSGYNIGKKEYLIPDRDLYNNVTKDRDNSIIKKGKQYDSEVLVKERKDITNYLKNHGYYNFSKDYIYFDVDTSLPSNQVKVGIGIRNPKDKVRHQRYKLSNIYIEPIHQVGDTLRKDTNDYGDYKIIGNKNIVDPNTLINLIDLQKDQLYTAKDVNATINQLSQLAIFKFVEVKFKKVQKVNSNTSEVACYILLTPRDKHEINLEMELATTEEEEQLSTASSTTRYYGISPSIGYSNKNLFKQGILWESELRGGYELSNQWFAEGNGQNIFELGANTSIQYPNTFIPGLLFGEDLADATQTSINLSYLVEGNPNYQRSTVNANLTYNFQNDLVSHFVTPFNFNRVKTINKSTDFQERLESINNPLVESIFDTYLISGAKWSIVYNDKSLPSKNYWNIRWNIFETAGNLPWLYHSMLEPDQKLDESETFDYSIGNVGFYQYAKTDADISYYIPTGKNSTMVFHLAPGVGTGYGNTQFMPFERRYFVGGSNSLRGWAVREIGPGAYESKSNDFDLRLLQVGDLKFESNLEYRFNMFSILNGALFTDFGNVWTLEKEDNKDGGLLEEDFYREIAIATGYGLRFDFNFFILRLDLGLPLRSPAKDPGSRWVVEDADLEWVGTNVRFNIGIGYPF